MDTRRVVRSWLRVNFLRPFLKVNTTSGGIFMETAVRFFDHAQKKLQQVLEHEMPNIQTAAEFVTETC